MLLGLLSLTLISRAEAGCPSTLADVHLLAEQALLSYENWEFDSFKETRASLDTTVLCAADPLDPLTASQVHLVHALESGLDKKQDVATLHFRALLATDPTYVLPDSLAAPGSLLQRAFGDAKAADSGPTQRVSVDQLWLDGERARRIPTDRPFVAQLNEEGGLQTWLVTPPPLPDELQAALGRPPPSRLSVTLGGAGVASLAASGTLLFLASRSAAELEPALTSTEAFALKQRNRSMARGGAALAAVGLGLGVAGISVELVR